MSEWSRWGLGNCERVGKAHCVETLNAFVIFVNVYYFNKQYTFCRLNSEPDETERLIRIEIYKKNS